MSQKPTYEELEKKIAAMEEKCRQYLQENESLNEITNILQLLSEPGHEAVFIHDNGMVLHSNRQFYDMFGYEWPELHGKQTLSLTVAPEYIETIKHKVSSGDTTPYEAVGIRKDGTHFPMEISVQEKEYQGQKVRAVVIHDITNRVRAEAAIRENEAQYRSLVETMHDGLSIRDADDRMIYSNPSFCHMLGYTQSELLRQPTNLVYDKANWQILQDQLAKRGQGDPPQSYEVELTRKDGKKISVIISPQDTFNSKGELTGSFAIFTDITALKQIEKALKESEDKFRNLFHLIPHPIALTQRHSKIHVDFNNAYCSMIDYRPDEILGRTTLELGLFEEEDKKRLTAEFKRSGLVDGLEILIKTRSESNRNVLIFIREIQLKEEAFILTTFLDITERKQLEMQLQRSQKMEAIGTLAGGIAHDFNNILGIILGNTELALDDVPNWNPGYHNLQEVRRACLRARDVVKQILSFSRSSSQPLKPIKITPIIKESLKLLRSSIPTTIEIRQDITCHSDTIKADPTQFNQVLLNLCTNAAHAMMDSGGILSVRLDNTEINETTSEPHHKLAPGLYLELTVSDTGEGIAPEVMGRIFDPYFTTKDIGEGTGIGLAVVHGIVSKVGGEITVESQLNKGTSLHVFLPCIQESIEFEHALDEKPLPMGNERILFIDDEKNMVETIPPLLERLGYHVEAAINAGEALKMFLSGPEKFDLVITDQTMPQMTGIEFIKYIREKRQDIPIILCTGFSESIDEGRAMEFGINAFMMKPFEINEIANVVRSVLDRSKTR